MSGGPEQPRDRVPPSAGPRWTLLRIEGYLRRHSPAFVLLVGLLLVALVAVLEPVTGGLSLSVFYLIPIGLVTFSRGRVLGAVTALMASIAITIGEVHGGMTTIGELAMFGNVLVRFLLFLIFVLLAALARDVVLRERASTAEETEVAEGLRELNELKDTLLRAVSHDLKGPIAAIRGSVNTLRRAEHLKLTDEQRNDLLDAIGISAARSERLIGDLLDLERLDRGVMEPDRAPTDLEALAARVVDESTHLSAHPVRIESPEAFLISVDAREVERILDNLLTNAAKHTPIGTPVLVRVRRDDAGAVISVEDEGSGIPDAMKTMIFEAFRQGDDARSSGKGTGIGLSLVAKFAELHGGRAWVEDRPGGGSVFLVELPGDVAPIPRIPVTLEPPTEQPSRAASGA